MARKASRPRIKSDTFKVIAKHLCLQHKRRTQEGKLFEEIGKSLQRQHLVTPGDRVLQYCSKFFEGLVRLESEGDVDIAIKFDEPEILRSAEVAVAASPILPDIPLPVSPNLLLTPRQLIMDPSSSSAHRIESFRRAIDEDAAKMKQELYVAEAELNEARKVLETKEKNFTEIVAKISRKVGIARMSG